MRQLEIWILTRYLMIVRNNLLFYLLLFNACHDNKVKNSNGSKIYYNNYSCSGTDGNWQMKARLVLRETIRCKWDHEPVWLSFRVEDKPCESHARYWMPLSKEKAPEINNFHFSYNITKIDSCSQTWRLILLLWGCSSLIIPTFLHLPRKKGTKTTSTGN